MKLPINVVTITPENDKGVRHRQTAIYGDAVNQIQHPVRNADLIDNATTVEEIRELGPMISVVDDEREANAS